MNGLGFYGESETTLIAMYISKRSEEYIEELENELEDYRRVRAYVRNADPFCLLLAANDYCTQPGFSVWFTTHCCIACRTCHLLHYYSDCPMAGEERGKPAIKSGDLHATFHRITTDQEIMQKYQPVIHSHGMPNGVYWPENDDISDLKYSPWVVTLENVLSDNECDRLIKLGKQAGYERSEGISDELNEHGEYDSSTVDYRTSKNTWWYYENDPVTIALIERVEELIGIPAQYSESIQLLSYDVGDFYDYHHDFHVDHLDRPFGPRILTVFVYLNDVEGGGGTRFRDLNITVVPKRGRVLIWPNVWNDRVQEMEEFTFHEALPVEKGQKFAANIWYHLYSYENVDECGSV